MVAIPSSPGVRTGLQANPTAVAPSMAQAGQIGAAVEQLGQVGTALAVQRMEFETRRTQALQSAKSLDYSTKIQEIDNKYELAAQQIPSTPDKFQGMSEKLSADRDKEVAALLGQESDEVVKNLAGRYANQSGVAVRDKFNRYQLSKEAEYGKYTIEKSLDRLGEQLATTSDPNQVKAINSQINSVLKTGLSSRYISYDFIDSYQDKQKRIAAQKEAAIVQNQALNSYLDGTAFADPNSASDQKIINGAFSTMINSNDPDLQAKAVNLSAKTGIVPSQLVSTVSGRLTTGNVQQKVQAAQIVSQLTNATSDDGAVDVQIHSVRHGLESFSVVPFF